MKAKKCNIIVFDYGTIRHLEEKPEPYAVEAWCVGGEEGVFAIFKDPRKGNKSIISFASGDDGSWWFVDSYDQHWLTGIVDAFSQIILDN